MFIATTEKYIRRSVGGDVWLILKAYLAPLERSSLFEPLVL